MCVCDVRCFSLGPGLHACTYMHAPPPKKCDDPPPVHTTHTLWCVPRASHRLILFFFILILLSCVCFGGLDAAALHTARPNHHPTAFLQRGQQGGGRRLPIYTQKRRRRMP